ncbi:MAG: hypothetical protein MUF31_07080 [Akkermansiaceae bacterium]|jgi:hypothetical protein|nr:hypothetical protein [Akkermansiaceae bacterium]
MRNLAGIFLSVMGACFAAPSLLAWVFFTATAQLALSISFREPLSFAIWLGVAFTILFFLTLGHLMVRFAYGLLRDDESPFRSSRPYLWFTLRTLSFLLLSTIIGSALGLFMTLISNSHNFVLALGLHLISLPLLIHLYRIIGYRIDEIEH